MRLFALIGLVLFASCTQPFGNLLKGGSSVPTDIAPLSTDAISTQTLSPIGGSPPSPAQPVPPPSPAPSIVAPPVQDEPASAQEMACRNRGGIWGKAGRLNAMACFQQTKDGGASCSKESDCTTQCLARSRTCAPIWPIFGCSEVLQRDGRLVTLCLD